MNDVERYHNRVKKRLDARREDYGVKGMKWGEHKSKSGNPNWFHDYPQEERKRNKYSIPKRWNKNTKTEITGNWGIKLGVKDLISVVKEVGHYPTEKEAEKSLINGEYTDSELQDMSDFYFENRTRFS